MKTIKQKAVVACIEIDYAMQQATITAQTLLGNTTIPFPYKEAKKLQPGDVVEIGVTVIKKPA